METRKVLITGGSGFVGSTLCRALADQGCEFRLLLRKTSSREHLQGLEYTSVEGDLRDRDSLEAAVSGVDVVFHVAGVISAPSKSAYFASNGEGTRNLAEAAQQFNPNLRRFVYVSSIAAAGPATESRPCKEEDSPKPISIYGASKLAGEDALRVIGATLPSVIVRPPVVYGPRDRGLFTFFQIVNSGVRPSIVGRGGSPGAYSFVHVDDLVSILVEVGLTDRKIEAGEVFHASGDGEYSLDQTMSMMGEALGKKSMRVPIPILLVKGLGLVLGTVGKITGKSLPFNSDKAKEIEVLYWTCSNQKVKDQLSFAPSWTVERGLKQTARWYQDAAWL